MKRILIGTLLAFLFIVSCDNNEYLENEKYFSAFINNDSFINNIRDYKKKLKNEFTIITLDYSIRSDTNIFELSYNIDMAPILFYPPVHYFYLENTLIIINTELDSFKSISDKQLNKILKAEFPNEYEKYLRNKEIPVMTTFENEVWVIKFKNDKLVSKSVYPIAKTNINKIRHEYY